LDVEQAEQIARESHDPLPAPSGWEAPASQPLLPDLLRLAARDRRPRPPGFDRLDAHIDRLQEALEAHRAEEARRLHGLKLAALAEFAAGAGHEINNPLAVISGQAQYLIRQLELLDGPADEIVDPAEYLANLRNQLVPSLQKIVGQTQRIHGILTELMQFARPPSPKVQRIDPAGVIRDVVTELEPLAGERRVRLVCPVPEAAAAVRADPAQVRAALTALLRNAIEAAPAGGWAGVRLERDEVGRVVLAVEDSGPGPGPLAREHLFDPFFSGRSAGRGRGLGLSTAWRLARQHDGDLRFEGRHDGVTRFSLILPAADDAPAPIYASGRNGSAHHE
jgi:two-component system, NtrC family, sensor kinase